MEEASGDRVDVINGVHWPPAYDLLGLFPDTPPLDSAPGKVNDGIHFLQYRSGGRRLITSNLTSLAYGGGGFDFCFWIKFAAFGAAYVNPDDSADYGGSSGRVELDYTLTNAPSEGSAQLRLLFTATDDRFYDGINFGVLSINGGAGLTDDVAFTPWVADTWHFIRWFFTGGSYPTGGRSGLQIDNGSVHLTSSTIFLPAYTKAALQFNQSGNDYLGEFGDPTAIAEEFVLDEFALAKGHVLSTAQASYLYNAGAGRTWPF